MKIFFGLFQWRGSELRRHREVPQNPSGHHTLFFLRTGTNGALWTVLPHRRDPHDSDSGKAGTAPGNWSDDVEEVSRMGCVFPDSELDW